MNVHSQAGRGATAAVALAVAGLTLVAAPLFRGPSEGPTTPEVLTPTTAASATDTVTDVASDTSSVTRTTPRSHPAPWAVITVGGWRTSDGALIAAGGTTAAADTAVLTAFCADQVCPSSTTRWTVNGTDRPGNPVRVTSRTSGTITATFAVDGRPAPSQPVTIHAVARAVDIPVDGWAASGTAPPADLVALAWADVNAILPTCPLTPGSARRLCPTPEPGLSGPPVARTDGTVVTPGNCADGWAAQLIRGSWRAVEGVEPGCVTRSQTAHAFARAVARPVDVACTRTPCEPGDAVTLADLYATAADAAVASDASTSCSPLGIPDPCPPGVAAALAAGAPRNGLDVRSLTDPATRADTALLVAWASGQRWMFDGGLPAVGTAVVGQPATVAVRVSIPDGWGSATMHWPTITGTDTSCTPTPVNADDPVVQCNYTPTRTGLHAADGHLTGPAGQTRPVLVLVSATPARIGVALDRVSTEPNGVAIAELTADTATDSWALRSPTGDDVRSIVGDGWSAQIINDTPTTATVRVVGTAHATPFLVMACDPVGCGSAELALNVGTDSTVVSGDRFTEVVASGPADVDLSDGTWMLTTPGPMTWWAVFTDGTVTPVQPADPAPVAMLRLVPPDWWAKSAGGLLATFTNDRGDLWTVCLRHPDGNPSDCAAVRPS